MADRNKNTDHLTAAMDMPLPTVDQLYYAAEVLLRGNYTTEAIAVLNDLLKIDPAILRGKDARHG